VDPVPLERLSVTEYLSRERTSAERHEYVNGTAYAMAGGTPLHAALCANVTVALGSQLRGQPCRVASSDLRVHVPATGLYTYPDVTVVCGQVELHAQDDTVIVNPRVVVEVLSEATESYDRGAKFSHYRALASLEEYLLVARDGRRLEHYRRLPSGQWLLTVADAEDGPGAGVELPALGVRLAIADVLDGIEVFAPPPG
jgi:Uma2 family endonuclease